MPVYEYHCRSCGSLFSRLSRSVKEEPSRVCPTCGAGNSERRISSFALHRSLQTQIDQIDPRLDRQLDAADSRPPNPLDRLNLS